MTMVILALLGGVVGGALLSDFGGFVFGAAVGALAGWVLELGGRVRALERQLGARKGTDARAPAEATPPPRTVEPPRASVPTPRTADAPAKAAEVAPPGPPQPSAGEPRPAPAAAGAPVAARATRTAAPRKFEPSPVDRLLASAAYQLEAGAMRFARERDRMVDEQLIARGVADPRVIAAMRRVPRRVRGRGAARSRVRRSSAADRRGADHLAAVHRRPDDRSHELTGRASSRSVRGAATRPPCSPNWQRASTRSSAFSPPGGPGPRTILEGLGYTPSWVRTATGQWGGRKRPRSTHGRHRGRTTSRAAVRAARRGRAYGDAGG